MNRQWENAYDEFLEDLQFLRRPSGVFGSINHPLMAGNYLVNLEYIYGKCGKTWMH